MVGAIVVPPPPGPMIFHMFVPGSCANPANVTNEKRIAKPSLRLIKSLGSALTFSLSVFSSAADAVYKSPVYGRFETRSPNAAKSLYLLAQVVYMIPVALGVLSSASSHPSGFFRSSAS